jgi:Flp pilus assembly protein TadG
MVEFALILPVMILLLLGAIDFGRLFFTYIQVTNAAREAAAFAAADPTVSQATVAARADQEAKTQSQRGEGSLAVDAPICQTVAVPPVTVSCATAQATNTGTGNQVLVNVSRPFTFLTPIIGNMFGTLTLSASAASPIDNPAPTPGPTPAPTPPPDPCTLVADFTFDQSGKNSPVTFDATNSTPQSGGCAITKYSWNFDDSTPPDGTYDKTDLAGPTTSNDYGNGPSNWGKQHTVTLKVANSSGSAIFQQIILTVAK